MKKKALCIALSFLLLAGCQNKSTKSTSTSTIQITQIEATKADMSNYVFLNDQDHRFKEISLEDSISLIQEGTGIVVYSFEECPFCNRALPVLNTAAKEANMDIYYVDIYSDAFMSKTNEEKQSLIKTLYDTLESILPTEKDANGNEVPSMQVPEVVAVKNGVIQDHHLGILSDFKLDKTKLDEYQVSDAQVKELKDIYLKLIQSIA